MEFFDLTDSYREQDRIAHEHAQRQYAREQSPWKSLIEALPLIVALAALAAFAWVFSWIGRAS